MVDLICEDCEFRFKRKEITETCPYCGKKKVILENSAEDIVKEVENLIE